MLKKNDKMPEFEGVNQDGKTIKSTDFAGQKYIIYFFPKANTPGCTAESCNLRDHNTELREKGYNIIGVSADSVMRQKDFSTKFDLPFPLISDEDNKIINAFGVWGRKKFMGKEYDGIIRTTFIINEKGFIEEVIEKVKTKEHAQQILNL